MVAACSWLQHSFDVSACEMFDDDKFLSQMENILLDPDDSSSWLP